MDDIIAKVKRRVRRATCQLVMTARDRLWPELMLRARTEDGVLPHAAGDVIGSMLWMKGKYENAERAAVRRLLASCRVCVDVGANSGIYTLLAARHCRARGVVYSFEASPLEFAKLERTIRWNRLANVVASNIALSEADGALTIYESLDGRGALNRVDQPAYPGEPYRAQQIACRSLDSFLAERGVDRVDFMKVDVEGHELPVLKGARRTVEQGRPVMMIEMNDRRKSAESSPLDVWMFLESLAYRWCRAEPDGRLVPFERPAVFGYLNLFAVPEERAHG